VLLKLVALTLWNCIDHVQDCLVFCPAHRPSEHLTSRPIKLYNIFCRRTTFSPLTQTTALTVSAMLLDHIATSVTQLQDSVAVGVVSLVGDVTPAPIRMLRLLCVVVRVRHCSSLPPYLFFLKLMMRIPGQFLFRCVLKLAKSDC